MQISIPGIYIEGVVDVLIERGFSPDEANRMIEENCPIIVSQFAHQASAELCAAMLID